MKRRNRGLNRHQRAARKPGEERVSKAEIEELLCFAVSEDPEDRIFAATYMCPCHVRHHNEAVWQALYLMMEDQDPRVRRRAWHTLEGGGCPNDPVFEPILKRTLEKETDRQVLGFAKQFYKPYQDRERVSIQVAGAHNRKQRGKCDFCGHIGVYVMQDFETEIPGERNIRAAWICDACMNENA